MAKSKDIEQPQQTMEEYLLSQLETPVKLKDGTVASTWIVVARTGNSAQTWATG